MTVEASVIVPLCFLVTALMIALLFFEHNRVYYCAAACEASVSGNFWYPDDGNEGGGQEAAELAVEKRIREAALPGQSPEVKVTGNKAGTEVICSHRASRVLGYDWTFYEVRAHAAKVRPAGSLRLSRTISSGVGR